MDFVKSQRTIKRGDVYGEFGRRIYKSIANQHRNTKKRIRKYWLVESTPAETVEKGDLWDAMSFETVAQAGSGHKAMK